MATFYKTRITGLGGKSPDRIYTTKLKTFLAYFESLTEFKEGMNTFLDFNNAAGSVLKTVYKNKYDDDALILPKPAGIIRKEPFQE